MQLIDTHVHLNFEAFESDLDAVAARWREIGVVRLVHSCVELSEFPVIQRLAQRYAELYFAVGLHPLDAEQWIPDTETQIQALVVSDPKVVAIGETGLDFYKAANGDQQQAAFYGQLRVAHQLNLPVIIHCRDAAAPMLECLNQFWAQYGPVRGVMHCWSGTPAETQQFLDLGFYISFSGIVTFKNAKQIHASAQIVPLNQLLIETDCPFLAPVPKRGERRNEPANVYYVAQRLADLRGLSLSQLAAQTTENACHLFGLPQPIPTATLIEA